MWCIRLHLRLEKPVVMKMKPRAVKLTLKRQLPRKNQKNRQVRPSGI
jgi:hypothetical protein